MILQFQTLIDAIPHPIPIGCIAITIGFILAGLASAVKTNADRSRNSRKPENKRKSHRLQRLFIVVLVLGGFLTGFGTLLTINGGRLNGDAQAKAAQTLLDATRKENEEARKEYTKQLQMVLLAVNAAKQEQTRLLTEERLKVIGNDLSQWVEDFAKRRPDKQRQFQQARVAQRQKEIQISSDSAQLFSLIMRFVEDLSRAYGKQTGVALEIKIPPFPEDYYDPAAATSGERYIRFGGKSQWTFYVYTSAPANEDNPPYLQIVMTDPTGRSGVVNVQRMPKSNKFVVNGSGTLPVPEASSLFQEYELDNFEQTLKRVIQRFLEAQLLEAPVATPSPGVSGQWRAHSDRFGSSLSSQICPLAL